jgi:ribosomal protein L20
MPRATNNVAAKRRHKKYMKAAKGNFGGRRKLYRTARETVQKGMVYSYRDRRNKKREFRALWIIRINAAARLYGLSYKWLKEARYKIRPQDARRFGSPRYRRIQTDSRGSQDELKRLVKFTNSILYRVFHGHL